MKILHYCSVVRWISHKLRDCEAKLVWCMYWIIWLCSRQCK